MWFLFVILYSCADKICIEFWLLSEQRLTYGCSLLYFTAVQIRFAVKFGFSLNRDCDMISLN